MLPQSTMAPAPDCWPRRPGSRRRRTHGRSGSTPTTSHPLSVRASSISLARMSRPPTKLIRWRAMRSLASRSSPGRRSKRRRSTLAPSNVTRPGSMAEILRAGTKSSRPPIFTTRPTMGGCGLPSIRAIRSWTRPSLSPVLASTSGRLRMPERWISSVGMTSGPRRGLVQRAESGGVVRQAQHPVVGVVQRLGEQPRHVLVGRRVVGERALSAHAHKLGPAQLREVLGDRRG